MRYNDRKLRRLFAALDPTGRKKVIKGACRKVGNEVRKVAVNNLRASGLNHAEEMSEGVRAVVFKREAGFRVTVASRKANKRGKGEKGMHRNRYGNKKPVLVWAEIGTRWRKSKKDTRYSVGGKWVTGRTRGYMKRYGFISKTKGQVEHSVGHRLKDEIATKVTQIAKKYGCT